mmetsp:Transcript_776/g.1158  ORF Transcript_776/g.1158 Transcript_776/m.1158 type:complete len:240 (+) Transcript_776:122-841(+)
MNGTNSDLSSTSLMSNTSAPATKPSALADVQTTLLTSGFVCTSSSQSLRASSRRFLLMVLYFWSRLSNLTTATPSAVTCTFWKYWYFRSGVGAKVVVGAAVSSPDDSSSTAAAASLEKCLERCLAGGFRIDAGRDEARAADRDIDDGGANDPKDEDDDEHWKPREDKAAATVLRTPPWPPMPLMLEDAAFLATIIVRPSSNDCDDVAFYRRMTMIRTARFVQIQEEWMDRWTETEMEGR